MMSNTAIGDTHPFAEQGCKARASLHRIAKTLKNTIFF